MSDIDATWQTLLKWLGDRGIDTTQAKVSDWKVSKHVDAMLYVPVARRSNRVYLVRGDRVVGFSPGSVLVSEAYESL